MKNYSDILDKTRVESDGMMNTFKFFSLVYLLVLALILLPVLIAILTFWWVGARMLRKVFPGRDFFPVGKIFAGLFR